MRKGATLGATIKQRVKINAALSLIHAEGYDAQTVVNWAKSYMQTGHDARRAYEHALNEFIGGQPDLAPVLGKITRLIEASDPQTVAKYDQAISAYIATGDDAAINELGPMIARDSVNLAVRNGELPDGSINGASVEAALGFALADTHVDAAALPPSSEAAHTVTYQAGGPTSDRPAARPTDYSSQVSPFPAGGRIANRTKMDATFDTGSAGASRTILQSRVNAVSAPSGASAGAPQI